MNHKIKIIFGTEQVDKYENGIAFTKYEIKNYIKEYSFNTKDELDAFNLGMNEAYDWLDFCEMED